MDKRKHIEDLFKKYTSGLATFEETKELFAFFRDEHNYDFLNTLIGDEFALEDPVMEQELISSIANNVKNVVDLHIHSSKKTALIRVKEKKIYKFGWWAAAIVIIGLFGIYQSKLYKTNDEQTIVSDHSNRQEKATLTLENGEVIELDIDKEGIVVGHEALMYADGESVLQLDDIRQATLSTPRKVQYSTLLPDGTQVWLNAESSISYPTKFEGEERVVELKGEAYFEVAHDANHPFIVISKGQKLRVLGTSFNIKAYDNESTVVTTLVTGQVKLYSGISAFEQTLKPGQQSVLSNSRFDIDYVDTKIFYAWKTGEFRFRAAPLEDVLREIERWYDIDIDYSIIPKNVKIHVSIRKDKKLPVVLAALEKITDLKFEIEGRRLKIMR